MKFTVVTKNADGVEATKSVEADARFGVYEQVEKEGLTVVSIEEVGKGFSLLQLGSISFGTGIKVDHRIAFTKNLSSMLSAGLTLSRALSVIERQSTNKNLKKMVTALEDSVKSGSSFHEALMLYPTVFSKLYIAMTKAGEESGTLADTLKIVSKQMETSRALTKKVKGAMMYPSIILAAIFIIGILMLIYVVPTLSATFSSFGGQLPLATRVIVAASNFVIHNVIAVVGIVAGVGVGGFLFARSKIGSKTLLFIGLHFPVVSMLVRETYTARAARTLSSLLSSGVEMLTAIAITAEVVGENAFGKVLVEAEILVKKGEPLSTAFVNYPKLYPLFISEMISVGEETGKVSEMLGQVAQFYEDDVDNRTKDLSTIIEPVLMLLIGVFVGVFALSMIAPIYQLSSKI
jgi:type IV pilus assembly protein PilC